MLNLEELFPPESMTVMIVDDTRPNILVLQRALANTGYNISVTINAIGQKEILSVLESRFGFASEAIRHF